MIDPETAYADITDEISTVLVGNEDVIEAFTISVLTGGHVLVEGVPGVAKTTAADLFANVLGLEHRRLQMTPDMLPADITGTHVYHQSTESSELARGPIFSNAVVVDEITRATPKAQSALLEAMEEETVTIEGETLASRSVHRHRNQEFGRDGRNVRSPEITAGSVPIHYLDGTA